MVREQRKRPVANAADRRRLAQLRVGDFEVATGGGIWVAAGGKVTIHTLRHTFASRLVQAGVSLAKVSKLLGHRSVTTTEIYAHLAPNEVSEEATKVLNGLQKHP